ncbi:hypothetical protein [Reyranella soli]|uniref:DNA ligase (ATP) n=1 Tax=Reyranella soli TaxID=1230389 RepID=A0A512NRZ2_9HYPH|nr:hypothetical protein [Reyranella soli]GEP61715.1 hypothetical protein RSO01_88810 [Reyranella soli]
MATTKRATLYVRVSTDKEAVENQATRADRDSPTSWMGGRGHLQRCRHQWRQGPAEAPVLAEETDGLLYTDHVAGNCPRYRAQACKLGLNGAISMRADRPYAPSDSGIWVKSKCLSREEFVVVGWTDPEGSRSHIGALLLVYYTDDGRLHYAGRVGTGMTEEGAEAAGWSTGAAEGGEDTACRSATAGQPVRLATETVQGALGEA